MTEITIEKQNMDLCFVDSWIDGLEELSKNIMFSKIRTITLKEVQLYDSVAYDIFHEFVNITRLDILNSQFNSKQLANILNYINPYSLSTLDLSGSTFDYFNKSDFMRIGGLFCLSEIILPLNMDEQDQKVLRDILLGN